MKVIREGCFETNSSSMHSIHIASGKKAYATITPDADGRIVLNGGEFGWEEETYYDPESKASYCAIDRIHDELSLAMLVRVIKEHTGAKEVVFNFSDDYTHKNHSYIDHQSRGTSDDAFESDQTLKDFLFYPESYLETDNDNH